MAAPDTNREYIHPLIWCAVGAGVAIILSLIGAMLFLSQHNQKKGIVSREDAIDAKDSSLRLIKDRLKSSAQAVVRAYVQRDFRTYVSYLPDDEVARLGGLEKAASSMQELVQNMPAVIRAIDVQDVESFASNESTCIAVLPTTSIIELDGTPGRLDGFLLASSDDGGRTWKFLEGSSDVVRETRSKFPQLAKTLLFPERRQVIGDPSKDEFVMRTREVNGRWVPDEQTRDRLERLLDKARSERNTK